MAKDKQELWEKVEELFDYQIPEYIVNIGKTFIVLNVSDIITNKSKRLKVKIQDVAKYFRTEANSLSSGMRTIAGYHGDWRYIDSMAQECLAYFKAVNIDEMRRISKSYGLNPKF